MRSLKTTIRHIRRSPYQAFAAVLIMTVTFMAISIFTFLILGSSKIISYFESKPQVTAFFKDSAKTENIRALEDQLSQSGKVSKIHFVSKQEALKIYRQQNKNDPLLLDLVTADILPASLEISTYKIEDLASISNMLRQSSFVQEVIFQKDVVSTLTAWTDSLRKIGIALIVVLSIVSIFIMITIIGIRISQKRDEIEIIRLLGAGGWYIRWPFILEGIFYGVTGAFIAWIISSIGLLYETPFLESFLKGIPLLPVPYLFFLEMLGVELILAILLGAFASFIAVLRYLK
ncbi:permease-like cell division protein FtsX [Patescibacteria group bacterium]|nr:permease-like cell division protein FtsX [Patescibacteria group bacterium]MCL5010152.1 permease-like cell division protein FtsX [Patescibacteria group bacterium]